MITKIVEYGTEYSVEVIDAKPSVVSVAAPSINEGFFLMNHGLDPLPKVGDKGKIVFERDVNRGHWQFYPNK